MQHGHGDLVAVFRALRHGPARAGGAVSAGREAAAGERASFSIPRCATTPISRRASPRRPAKNTGIIHDQQRARQPRRLLALRAGILHARPRLAAGDGAAWRQRQRPRLPVELAARRPQPRRHPGRADRDRQHLGADGRRRSTRRTSPAFSIACASRWNVDPARLLLTGMSDGGTFCYVAGLERGSPFTHLAPVAADVPSADGGDGRRGAAARPADPSRPRPARLDVSGAGGAADPRRRCRRPAPTSPIARSTISATAIRARSTRRSWHWLNRPRQ